MAASTTAEVDTLSAQLAEFCLSAFPSPFLILFDVNGVMFTKVPKDAPERAQIHPDNLIPTNPRYDTMINPNIKDVILRLSEWYTVAIYSSTNYHNLIKTITAIFGKQHPFAFVADRPYTSLDPNFGHPDHPEVKSFDTIKPLTNIWCNPKLNEDRKWGPHNTLLVDNSLEKLTCNDPSNVLVVPEFTLKSYMEGTVPGIFSMITEAVVAKLAASSSS